VASGLDCVVRKRCEFGRAERLQYALVAGQNEAGRSKLEGIDLLEAGAVFLEHFARRVGGARARKLDPQIRILGLEAVDQRLDLRARRIKEQATFPFGARFQHGLSIGAGRIGNSLDCRRLRANRQWAHRQQQESKDAPARFQMKGFPYGKVICKW
jgi:hypothetical protein